MNLIQQMTVDGELQFGYAHLTVGYTFHNPQNQPISLHYFFPLPEGGLVTGLQLLRENGTLTRAKVCGVSDENLLCSGVSLRRISTNLCCLSLGDLQQGGIRKLLLELLIPLQEGRLVFPLGMSGTDDRLVYQEDCRIEMELHCPRQQGQIRSLFHPVEVRQEGDGTTISAVVTAGEDFVLELGTSKAPATALIQENWQEKIGLYHLNIQNPERYIRKKVERVLLLLDTDGVEERNQFALVRELFLRVLQAIPQGMPVQMVFGSAWLKPILSKATPFCDAVVEQAISALADCPMQGDLGALLQTVPQEEETLTFLISAGTKIPVGMDLGKVHLCTIGRSVATPLREVWEGEHTHYYPQENLPQRTAAMLKRLCNQTKPITVTAVDGTPRDLMILSVGDGDMEAVACSSGSLPTAFSIWQENVCIETISVKQQQVYAHLPMAEQIYAAARLADLRRLKKLVGPESQLAIKKQMEEIGVRYGVLSEETMFVVSGETGNAAIPVSLVLSPKKQGVRTGIFREDGEKTDKENIHRYIQILREHLRSDGSVRETDVLSVRERADRTAIARLALQKVKEKDPSVEAVLKAADGYLETHQPSEWIKALSSQEVLAKIRGMEYGDGVIHAAQMLLR
ncbi:MAG: hypothetical protein IJB80_04965 [Clostridia bacterium]|nr:hypothetical protein [Clostridia bacterium]